MTIFLQLILIGSTVNTGGIDTPAVKMSCPIRKFMPPSFVGWQTSKQCLTVRDYAIHSSHFCQFNILNNFYDPCKNIYYCLLPR